MKNLKKLCHNQRFKNTDDCAYLEYEREPQRKAENYDAPARYKFKWIKVKRG